MSEYPRLESAWIWPESIERLFRSQSDGETLHVCCGESDVGDVRLDRDPEREPDVVADMRNLPFANAKFDTVVADPPWKAIAGLGKTHQVFLELVRVTRPRGQILWNAYTIPSSDQCELEQMWVRQDYEEGRASFIGQYRRFPGQQTFAEVSADA